MPCGTSVPLWEAEDEAGDAGGGWKEGGTGWGEEGPLGRLVQGGGETGSST